MGIAQPPTSPIWRSITGLVVSKLWGSGWSKIWADFVDFSLHYSGGQRIIWRRLVCSNWVTPQKICYYYPTDGCLVEEVRGRGIFPGREETRGILSQQSVLWLEPLDVLFRVLDGVLQLCAFLLQLGDFSAGILLGVLLWGNRYLLQSSDMSLCIVYIYEQQPTMDNYYCIVSWYFESTIVSQASTHVPHFKGSM